MNWTHVEHSFKDSFQFDQLGLHVYRGRKVCPEATFHPFQPVSNLLQAFSPAHCGFVGLFLSARLWV